ncbi:MAG: methyltransferase domain-containing protein [Acidimicrobiia bacterium]
MNYGFAYRIGFHPWEDAVDQPEFTAKITELFEREESERVAPFGRALDIGTGSGIWGIELAKRGWNVTGVDIIENALERARERAGREHVDMELVNGDVTDLRAAGVGEDFRLVLDTGTFHDFDTEQQQAMGRGVDAIAAPDATVLLLCWPRRRRPLIRGVERNEIEAAFPGWKITDIEPSGFSAPKPLEVLLRPDEHWYRLRRE